MSAFTLSPGVTGPVGTGLSLLSWRNSSAMIAVDAPGTTRYLEAWGAGVGNAATSTIIAGRIPIKAPRAGVLRDFCVKFNVAAAVVTTFTVYVNGVATAITVTTSGTTPVFDLTYTVSVVLGDSVIIGVTYSTGAPNNTVTVPQAIVTLV